MKKARLVVSPKRGSIQITDAGLALLNENPSDLKSKDLLRYKSFAEFVNSSNKTPSNNRINKR